MFPVAGLGTRFLPATKTVPKEMLPIIDRPLIQYAVDEAVEAGCDTLIFVTNRYKHAVADYFDKAYELEQKLEKAGKIEQLELVRNVLPSHVRAVFVTQAEALGLGHAVLCAKPVVGDEPFAVLLPDDLIWNRGPGALKQMADAAERERRQHDRGAGRAARADRQLRHRRHQTLSRSRRRDLGHRRKTQPGSGAEHSGGGRTLRARRPHLRSAGKHSAGAGGEIQLTDAIAALLARASGACLSLRGTRFDCGTHIGLIEATIRYALDHEKLTDEARAYMTEALSR